MMHENDQVLVMVKAMCKKVIDLHDEVQEDDDCEKTYKLDDIAYLARLLTAEIGDSNGK